MIPIPGSITFNHSTPDPRTSISSLVFCRFKNMEWLEWIWHILSNERFRLPISSKLPFMKETIRFFFHPCQSPETPIKVPSYIVYFLSYSQYAPLAVHHTDSVSL